MKPSAADPRSGSSRVNHDEDFIAAGGPFTTENASATSPGVAAVAEASWNWKLRIISTDTASLTVVKDTEKEDRYKMIKDSWEANQQGRSIKPVAIMLTPSQEDLPPVIQIGKPKEVVITATGSDIVYKPWVILKDNGQGSRRLDSIDKQVSVFGTNGEKIVYDTSKIVSTASTGVTTASGTGRTISLFEEVNLGGLKPITDSSSKGLKERGSSANSKKPGGLTVGASPSSTTDHTNYRRNPAQIPQFQTSEGEKDDGLGEYPTTINDLQAYLKGKSTYTRRATLFSKGAQMVGGQKPHFLETRLNSNSPP
ncbi:UNVERIFIED_CONTAM: hypothetical protein HDU68_008113 [Siphonaria sp. JEL0065]|nr:hypothetical protein HDU68_008113 [Siphonaria sp. JEL0065]